MLGENIMSIIEGGFKFWLIIDSNPLPIETTKKTCGIMPINVAKKKFIILTSNKVGKIQLSCHGIPPINLYIKRYKNSDFLNLTSKLWNLFKNFSLTKSFKKKFPKIYKNVAPMLKPKTTIITPTHFPRIKPANKATGDPKPKKGNTHKITKNKKNKDNKNILVFFRFEK